MLVLHRQQSLFGYSMLATWESDIPYPRETHAYRYQVPRRCSVRVNSTSLPPGLTLGSCRLSPELANPAEQPPLPCQKLLGLWGTFVL